MEQKEGVLAQLDRFKKESAKRDFEIVITETLQMTVPISAANAEEAEAIARAEYINGDYILDAEHFLGAEFSVKELPKRERTVKPPCMEIA